VQGEPGLILAVDKRGIVVACGEGALCLTELQKAGGKRLSAQQFLAGTPIRAGARFALPDA
jgi:methionyl-tRNA formyltransferase